MLRSLQYYKQILLEPMGTYIVINWFKIDDQNLVMTFYVDLKLVIHEFGGLT